VFFSDHWRNIEPERLSRYEEIFQFRPDQEPILDGLELFSGCHVLDFGCGPGFLAEEIAERLTALQGSVTAVDLNKEFIARATQRAADLKLENIHYQHTADGMVPLPDNSVDRVLCKNVLEYVPQLQTQLAEYLRVIKPGGRVLIIDSDWGFVLVEPWGKSVTDAFFDAAGAAFKEPMIGRRLSGALAESGFTDVRVSISAGADLTGRGIGVLKNMASYILQFGTMPEDRVTALLSDLEAAVADGQYLFVLPQFYVSAIKAR